MIRYKLYRNNNETSKSYGKWYGRAVSEETIDTAALAKHMANHNSPFSAGVVKGILTDAVNCIKELVLDGKNVKLDDLAIFSAGLHTTAADSAADFSAAENIKDVKLRARATGILRTAQLTSEAKLKQFTQYTVEGSTDTEVKP